MARAPNIWIQSLPQRLLTPSLPSLSAEDLKTHMHELSDKQAELKELGLLDEPKAPMLDSTSIRPPWTSSIRPPGV